MNFLVTASNYILPGVIFVIILFGLHKKIEIYEKFIEGAKEGIEIVLTILPTLVGLMMAIGILRASGTLDYLSVGIEPLAQTLRFPAELLPLALIKLVSSSAATGMVLDIFKEYGTDSYLGRVTSLMMSCTETIFYTMSVYFMATRTTLGKSITKTRWTLPGALLATLAGIVASVVLAGWM